jgi:hypothetical protein
MVLDQLKQQKKQPNYLYSNTSTLYIEEELYLSIFMLNVQCFQNRKKNCVHKFFQFSFVVVNFRKLHLYFPITPPRFLLF